MTPHISEPITQELGISEQGSPKIPLQPGEQYRFHFDMTKCIGCKCCEVACHEQNNTPVDVIWRRVGEIEGCHWGHSFFIFIINLKLKRPTS